MKTATAAQLAALCLAMGAGVGHGSQVKLTWNPCADTNVSGYYLYASTNLLSQTNYLVKANLGTNNTVTTDGPRVGTWRFAVSAFTASGIESDLSNILTLQIPAAPTNARVVLEYSVTLTNWQDTGFFRVRYEP